MPKRIRILSGKKLLGEHIVNNNIITIGRSGRCELSLPSTLSEISSKHASMKEEVSILWVLDGDGARASTNGIYIDGSRIKPGGWVSVPENCTISLGCPTKNDAVLIRQVGSLVQQKTISPQAVARQYTDARAVPVHLTNGRINVVLSRPERDRSIWKTPINLLVHVAGLGIVIAILATVMGSTLEAGIVIAILVGLEIYFLPSTMSFSRDQPNRFAILALNLFLGWTLLGWVVSLVWSLTAR